MYCLCLACFVLITYIGGQERLYCTHEALNVAYDNPSAFCQVAGTVKYFKTVMIIYKLLAIMYRVHTAMYSYYTYQMSKPLM